MSKKINIGFDIGTTSVGWSIIDDDLNIIDMGVRLFDDPANPKDGKLNNEKRRVARSQRRRISRIRNRKDALINLFIDHKWVNSKDEIADLINIDINDFDVKNPVELKCKALKEKMSKEAMVFILFHYIHHRGYFYITEEDLDEIKDILETQDLNTKFPSEEIFEFYKENGWYKGAEINRKISAKRWESEIKRIFEVQGNLNGLLSDKFKEKYIDLFKKVRDFSHGPGNEKTPTEYGRYQLNREGKIEKVCENLWDKTIGKCTYFPEEFRGGKNSPKSEMFNFINDLNNLYLYNNTNIKLSKEAKEIIFRNIEKGFNSEKAVNLSTKNIAKWLGKKYNGNDLNDYDIKGYRIDKKRNELFTELKNYRYIYRWLINRNILDNSNNIFSEDLVVLNECNKIFSLLFKYKNINDQLEILSKEYNINIDNYDKENLIKKVKGLSQTHSLSYKAMDKFIESSLKHLEESDNQMKFFNKIKDMLPNNDLDKFKNRIYFPEGLYDDEIISPTARRAFNQNIKVMNKILKRYLRNGEYELNNITFELARDKNSAEERKSIENSQKENKKIIEQILKDEDRSDIDINKINGAARLRLKLWKEQEMIDLYDDSNNNQISFQDVITGKGLEVDHIIPYSISSIDAQYNKILTKSGLNKEKGNKTPKQWLEEKGKWEGFVDRVNKNSTYSNKKNKKREMLLYEDDPSSNILGFIERNLVDTRYASRVILNTFQDFFNSNKEKYPNVKIKVINGSLTNFARYQLFLDSNKKPILQKNRDLYCHHAIDASIVNCLGMNHNIKLMTEFWRSSERSLSSDIKIDSKSKKIYNNNTGEIIEDITSTWEKSVDIKNFGLELAKWNDTLYDFKHKVKFSRQLRTKNNVQLSNETIYSFRFNDDMKSGVIIKKIYIVQKDDENIKVDDLDKYFLKSSLDKNLLDNLIIYKNKHKMYDELFTIYNQYRNLNDKENPFVKYMKDHYNIDNPKYIVINDRKINCLKALGNDKNISNIIVLKSHTNEKNIKKTAIMESLNPISVRIYKNDEEYVTIPINQKVLSYCDNKLKIDEEKLNGVLKGHNIINKNYIEINNGTILIRERNGSYEKFYCNGGGNFNSNKIEIKSLYCNNKLLGKNSGQWQISISSVIKDFKLAEIDELGKIYNIRKIEL